MGVPISNVTRRVVYAASGTGPYNFTFEILAAGDVAVYKDDALLTLTTDYTVTINANGTGYITLTASPTGATQIAIVGNRTIQRTTDFVTGGDFFANTVNDEMDQQTIFAQQNAEAIDRALKAPQTDPTSINMTLPRASVRANKTLAFDASGNPTTGEVIGDNRGNWAAGTAYNKRDIVKDTSNGNVYYANTAHTSSGAQPISTNADSAKWDLIVDNASAGASATAAAASASAAATSASNASTSATNAASSASTASTQASNASTSATNAASSATAAASSASTASTAATNAGNSATAAATSATNASNSASSASTSATNASNSATSAATSASQASTSASNAASSASTATTQASNAATSATNAANSATASASSATNSANSATASANSATAAAGSATSAAASAAEAATFDPDLYLAKAGNLSGLADAATSRSNLGLAIGADVQAYDAQLTTLAGASADRATFLASSNDFTFRNRIINGDMRIDQRNAGASVTVAAGGQYFTDRWRVYSSQASKLSSQKVAVAPAGFTNSLLFTSLSAFTPAATDEFVLSQLIEGFNVADLAWGTANAQAVTVGFWVRSSLTGTFSGAVANGAGNMNYPFAFSINAANTFEYKTVTVPGATAGTWPTDNGLGLALKFNLGTGSTYLQPAGAWTSSIANGVTGSVALVATNGATFYITGVQLEAGSVATPFERRPYGTELLLCQRYLPVVQTVSAGDPVATGYYPTSTNALYVIPFQVPARVKPTGIATASGTPFQCGGSGAASGPPTFNSATTTVARVDLPVTSGTANAGTFMYSAVNNAQILFTGCEL